jgi:hypothetical protein
VANIVAIMGAWCHAIYHRSQAGEAPFGCGDISLRLDMWSSWPQICLVGWHWSRPMANFSQLARGFLLGLVVDDVASEPMVPHVTVV